MKISFEICVYLISALVGVPAGIYYLIELRENLRKKKDLFTMYLPKFSSDSVCIGRNAEKKIIKEHILSSHSIFIYGAAGIGKTTVIRQSIKETERKIRKKYRKVLYFKFTENTSFEFACNKLSHQIDGSGVNSFEELLNEGDYLIWLDECENTDCLDRLFNLSNRPVFIVASREKNQEKVMSATFGGNDVSLMINTLHFRDAERLLLNHSKPMLFFNSKYHSVNNKIVKLVNGHPLILYLIRQDYLYKSDPILFLNRYKDDINQFKIRYSGQYEEMLCKSLVTAALGLSVDKQIERLSVESQVALGLLGCLSDDEFIILGNVFGDIFKDDVIEELMQTSLFDGRKGAIKTKHSLVHEVLRENVERFLNNNYEPLFSLINTIEFIYLMYDGENDGRTIRLAGFAYIHHLYNAVKYAINKHLCSNSEDELKLCYGLYILADYGYYEDVISLMEQFVPIFDPDLCNEFYSLARIISYKGMGDYNKAVECAEEKESAIHKDNTEALVTAVHNLIFLYKEVGKYKSAIKKAKEFFEYLHVQDNEYDKNYESSVVEILSYCNEAIWYSCNNEDLDAFIIEQIKLINRMEELSNCDKSDIIDAKLILAFSFAKKGDEKYVLQIYMDIINSIRKWFSFTSPFAINTLYRIADFYFIEGNYDQANEIFREILPLSEELFGNGHTITVKIRSEYEKNKEKQEKNGIDAKKILFTISRNNRQHNKFFTIIKKTLNITRSSILKKRQRKQSEIA